MYARIYTRRGSTTHEAFLDAYIDHGKYIRLRDALYMITDVEWIPRAHAFRWDVARVERASIAIA